jgi:type I restriction enzyme, S subunit
MSAPARWDIPDSWEWISIGDIGTVTGGGTPNTSDDSNFSDNGIPWLTPADLTGYTERYIARGARDISENGLANSSAKVMPKGTVLFSSRAPIGYCAIAANPISTNQGFKSITLHGNLNPEYTYWYLRSAKDYVESEASGTTFKEISGSKMKALSFPLPPLAEQLWIVEKLDALSAQSRATATALTRIETLITRYKAAVLRAAFSDPKQSLRPTRLGDVFTGIKAGKNLRCVERPPLDNERGVVKVSAVTYGVFDHTQSKTLPKEFEPDADTLIRAGDFLFSRANTIELVGACTIVDAAPRNLYLSDKILRLDMPDERKAWVDLFLKSPIGRAALEEASSGNQHSMRNISQKALVEIPIPLPPLEEQAEIVARIHAAFAQLETLARAAAAARARLGALDRAILARAFKGKLVPQDPNDEPAGELLKRVKENAG